MPTPDIEDVVYCLSSVSGIWGQCGECALNWGAYYCITTVVLVSTVLNFFQGWKNEENGWPSSDLGVRCEKSSSNIRPSSEMGRKFRNESRLYVQVMWHFFGSLVYYVG